MAAPTVTVNVAVCPGNTLTELEFGVIVGDGATTVRDSLAVAVNVPLVPVIAIVPVPAVAAVVAFTVAIEVAPGATLVGLKLTLTPLGAVAVSDTRLLNPLAAPTATVKVDDCPSSTVAAEFGVRLSVGAATVKGSLAVTVVPPLVPLIAMVPEPTVAAVEAITVAVTVAPGLAFAVLKLTLTPLGAVADSETRLL